MLTLFFSQKFTLFFASASTQRNHANVPHGKEKWQYTSDALHFSVMLISSLRLSCNSIFSARQFIFGFSCLTEFHDHSFPELLRERNVFTNKSLFLQLIDFVIHGLLAAFVASPAQVPQTFQGLPQ